MDIPDNPDIDVEVMVVCSRGPSLFPDSIVGECSECKAQITWRPHNPEPSTKVCSVCAFKQIEESKQQPNFQVTKHTLDEVKEFLANRKKSAWDQ